MSNDKMLLLHGKQIVFYKLSKNNARSTFLNNLAMLKKYSEGFLPGFVTPAGNYMFKVSNRNIRTRCELCSKLTIKTPE